MLTHLQQEGVVRLKVRVPLVTARALDSGDGEVFLESATNGLLFDGCVTVLETDPDEEVVVYASLALDSIHSFRSDKATVNDYLYTRVNLFSAVIIVCLT